MEGAAEQSQPVTTIAFPEDLHGSRDGEQAQPIATPLELALRSTEAALGQVTKVVLENIRLGGEASPHVEAAERDLRNALRKLGIAKRRSHRSL